MQNGIFFCSFKRNNYLEGQKDVFDLNKNWFMMFAEGPAVNGKTCNSYTRVCLMYVEMIQSTFQHKKYTMWYTNNSIMLLCMVLRITFIIYLSYQLHCCMLPDKRCLSHGMCLYQVMMMLHFLNDVTNDAQSTQKSKITS